MRRVCTYTDVTDGEVICALRVHKVEGGSLGGVSAVRNGCRPCRRQ